MEALSPTRAAIFRLMKEEGFVSITRIAEVLGISHEAARKQVAALQENGWIEADCEPPDEPRRQTAPGRPSIRYCLTPAGDQFFPKRYPELSIGLLDVIRTEGGTEALTITLTRLTDERVAAMEPRVQSLPMKRKMEALRTIYMNPDPFTYIQRRNGDFVLIERNCPYLNVALERPEICSTTVSTLRRLTGCEVVRERRFQDGDGRCEFHVRTAEASPDRKLVRFEKEPSRTN